MNLAEFTHASLAIQLHMLAAILAFLLGGYVLIRRKGDRLHRNLGKAWVALMAVTALTSFAIHTIRLIGPFSPIHILSVVVLVSLVAAVRAARRRDIPKHLNAMRMLYLFALIGAGAFTFLPGRLMNRLAFHGDAPWTGYAMVALAAVYAVFVASKAYPDLLRRGRRIGKPRSV